MNTQSSDAVRHYYAQYDEWGRLDTPAGALELERCLRILCDHLEPHSRILDLGGGPGRYTIELARRGHRPSLVDLSDEHIGRARRELAEHNLLDRVDLLAQGDARSLDTLEDASFDAVVAFGPFYHLTDRDGRQAAAAEIARVLVDSGLVFAQFLPPASGYVRLLERAADHPEQIDAATIDRAMGEHRFQNPSSDGFQEGYYAGRAEIRALFSQVGMTELDAVSARGIAAGREEKLAAVRRQNPGLYDKVMSLVEQTARMPEVIAMGQIAVWVGRKELRH